MRIRGIPVLALLLVGVRFGGGQRGSRRGTDQLGRIEAVGTDSHGGDRAQRPRADARRHAAVGGHLPPRCTRNLSRAAATLAVQQQHAGRRSRIPSGSPSVATWSSTRTYAVATTPAASSTRSATRPTTATTPTNGSPGSRGATAASARAWGRLVLGHTSSARGHFATSTCGPLPPTSPAATSTTAGCTSMARSCSGSRCPGATTIDGHTNQAGVYDWPAVFRHLPLATSDQAAGHVNAAYREWLRHPRRDDPYWNGMSRRAAGRGDRGTAARRRRLVRHLPARHAARRSGAAAAG